MSRDTRLKASDVHRDANYVFSQKKPFDEAFPEIADIRIEVAESTDPIWGTPRARVYSRENGLPGEFVDCHNSSCYNGGFSVGQMIRDMLRDKKTEAETAAMCRGYEGSPKGRRRYRTCLTTFKVKIQIVYRATP